VPLDANTPTPGNSPLGRRPSEDPGLTMVVDEPA
jgi:hypothetical protein